MRRAGGRRYSAKEAFTVTFLNYGVPVSYVGDSSSICDHHLDFAKHKLNFSFCQTGILVYHINTPISHAASLSSDFFWQKGR